jgi:hypothetical protein
LCHHVVAKLPVPRGHRNVPPARNKDAIAMTPNIDRRGRIARAVSGALTIALGIGLWPLGWPGSFGVRLLICLGCLIFGAFQLYEAKRSWCVMRACGIRTPM